MVNRKTFENLVDYYNEYGMFDCGIFGTDILLKVLFENGYGELAYKLMTGEGKYSFGAWKNKGATTLHEYWIDGRSYNHPMFGGYTKYLFQYILGVRQEKDCCGFKSIIINPAKINLAKASGRFETVLGTIKVSILRNDYKKIFTVSVPGGVSARFIYNDTDKILKTGKNIITV